MLSGLTALFPGALALAALVPLIWWLHRARSRGEPLEVSSLWLFRKKEAASPALIEPRRDKRADPAWIRRALLVLALAGALAGLGRLTRTPPVTVWIDGSASLKTREHGETRLQGALAQLDRRLAARRIGRVTLRSLARPDFTLRLRVPFDARRVAKEIPIGAPGSTSASPLWPEPSTLDPAAEQWLVTDGADPALLRWLSAAPIAHLVQAGTLTENTAVTLIAYRPTLAGNGCGDLIVTVYNAGLATSHRRLDVTAPPCPASPAAARPSATELTLPAGATRTLHFTVGSPPFRIEARLAPADALPDDDALALDLARPLAARVAVDPACGRALAAAVAADPAVVSAPPRTAQLLVDCSFRFRGSPLPRLIVHPASHLERLTQPLRWMGGPTSSISATLPVGLLAGAEPLTLTPGSEAVLSAGARALAVVSPGPPRRLDTVLDLEDKGASGQSAYPLLIASLLDATAGEVLTARVARAARAAGEARIAPDLSGLARWERAHRRSRAPLAADASSDLTPAMLVLALLLALWESAAALASLAAVRRYYSGAPR